MVRCNRISCHLLQSASSSTLPRLLASAKINANVLVSSLLCAKLQLLWLWLIDLHVDALLLVVLQWFLQSTSFLIFLGLLSSLLSVQFYQRQLVLVLCLAGQTSVAEPASVFNSRFPFGKVGELFILEVEHLIVLPGEPEGSQEFICMFEDHYFGANRVVGGLYTAVLLLKGAIFDAAYKHIYFEVSLLMILRPSARAWPSLACYILSRIASTRS